MIVEPDLHFCITRYENDPVFHKLVTAMVKIIVKFNYNLKDLNQAVWTAITIAKEMEKNKY